MGQAGSATVKGHCWDSGTLVVAAGLAVEREKASECQLEPVWRRWVKRHLKRAKELWSPLDWHQKQPGLAWVWAWPTWWGWYPGTWLESVMATAFYSMASALALASGKEWGSAKGSRRRK